MAKIPIAITGLRCDRCGYEWVPRNLADGGPKVCPRCNKNPWLNPEPSPT